jgi:hypothetical protein
MLGVMLKFDPFSPTKCIKVFLTIKGVAQQHHVGNGSCVRAQDNVCNVPIRALVEIDIACLPYIKDPRGHEGVTRALLTFPPINVLLSLIFQLLHLSPSIFFVRHSNIPNTNFMYICK